MGGSERAEWIDVLDASFEAGIAREEEAAAADLAFSLRQDVGMREAVARSASGWVVCGVDAGVRPADEIGADYVRSGPIVMPMRRAVLRSAAGASTQIADRDLLQLLGAACRRRDAVTVAYPGGEASGRLVRVGRDHVAVQKGDLETIVGLTAIEWIRLGGYSASRGFSG